MADNPITAVFGAAELLEAILFNVDMRTLLLSQRVSKDFKGTISGSPALQEALFFKAETPATTRGRLDGKPMLNPLLRNTQITIDDYGSRVEFAWDHDTKRPCIGYHVHKSQAGRKPEEQTLYGSWQKMLIVQPPIGMDVISEDLRRQRKGHRDCHWCSTGLVSANETMGAWMSKKIRYLVYYV